MCAVEKVGFTVPFSDNLGQFVAVRRDHRGVFISGVVVSLRIDQDRTAESAALLDHIFDAVQTALAVIGKNDDIMIRQQRGEAVRVLIKDCSCDGGFKIGSQHLLVARKNTKFERRSEIFSAVKARTNFGCLKEVHDFGAGFVIADDRKQRSTGF